jgi:hypothetical protein
MTSQPGQAKPDTSAGHDILPQQYPDGELDPQAYYDPNVNYENLQSYVGEDGNTYYYYYQPEEGNGVTDEYDSEQNPMQEFYAAAADGGANSASEGYQHDDGNVMAERGTGGAVPPTLESGLSDVAATLVRTYEYEDYAPPSNGWVIDVIVEAFLSLANRLYLSLLMGCAGAVIFTLCISYSYACLYRAMEPPNSTADPFWQSMAYVAIFITLSIVITAVFCTFMDMLRCVWGTTRQSTSFWGFSHQSLGKEKPPFVIYLVILLATTALPIAWGFLEVIIDGKSVLSIASIYFYIAIVVMMWLIAFCFAWFYWTSMIEKRRAYARRFLSDDLREKRIVSNGQAFKKVKSNWYYSESALEEYGLDKKITEWSAPVWIIGLVPIFSTLAAIARVTRSGNPNTAWIAIGIIFISIMLLMFQMTTSKNHAHRTVFINLFLILLLFVLGLIGCGVASSGPMFAVLFILCAASQGLLLRKRQHSLTRKEVCALLKIAIDRDEEEERKEERWDTYMCCCRNTIMAAIQWLDIKTIFGFRHPKVREFEKRIVIENPTLRADYKVLLVWWVTLFGCICFVLGIHNRMSDTFDSPIAAAATTGGILSTAPPVCLRTYDNNSSKPLRIVDLALLSTLGRTTGEVADLTFAQWFYQYGSFVREFPAHPASTKELLGTGSTVPFTVYRNVNTNFRVIVLQQQLYGSQMLQAMDYWGEEVALQIAGVLAPLVASWSITERSKFIRGARFFKDALNQEFDLLSPASAWITSSSSYASKNMVIVGEGYNGGYAKLLGKRLGISSVSFNAPGVSSMFKEDVIASTSSSTSTSVDLAGYILSLVDLHAANEVDERFSLTCGSASSIQCSSIVRLTKRLIETCGDVYGRGISV